MRIPDTSAELLPRTDKRSGFHIECSPTLMAAIDQQVTASSGTAGVLFGSCRNGLVRVLAFRPVDAGVPFPAKADAGLRDVLLSAKADPELETLVPVGWYRSRTRSRPSLDRRDLAIFRRHFPRPWQVALVLCPDPPTPTRAAFFFHASSTGMHAETLREEFTIPRPGSAAFQDPEKARRDPPPIPPEEKGSGGPPWWVWVLSAILLILPFVGWFEPAPPKEQARGFSLRLSDDTGRLRIEWDREAPQILAATGGRLEIVDGPNATRVNLDRADLRNGSVIYWRSHGETKVRMVLDGSGPEQVQESAHFVGPPAAIEPAPETQSTPSDAAWQEYLRQADSTAPALPLPTAPQEHPRPPAAKPLPRAFRLPVLHKPAPDQGVPPVVAPPQVAVAAPTDPPTAPPVQSSRLPEPPRVTPPGPRRLTTPSGQAIWTGMLERRGVVQIEGQRASQGYLSAPLPGTPVTLNVLPGELTPSGLRLYTTDARLDGRSEAPGPQNGWNRAEYVYDPMRAGEISILEAPSEQNGWRHLVLRSENRSHSVVVLRWQPIERR
ncbi:MAG TPA: hypothetical protein VN442_20605 [Bryobacteraceae bacterium]|nr:hypothetical protein [Bryobacteraceae bacterium]